MPNINITVAGKIATNTTPGEIIVCGNGDYTITFDLDGEWAAETVKTARFVYAQSGVLRYMEVAFTGLTVEVPVLTDVQEVYVGIYTDNVRTTTPARILCDRSILCGGGVHAEPPEDVYLQILELINNGAAGKSPYQYAVEAGFVGTEEEFKELLLSDSIKQYGAVGDGVTNDTAAFQEALANERKVFVPGGTFVLDGTLVIRENCCLTLSQDTILKFTQTEGNCIEMRGSVTLRGNHGIIDVSSSFTGNVISVDTGLDGVVHASIPPYEKSTPQWKRQRFIYDVNITRTEGVFQSSLTGGHSGTALYISANYETTETYDGVNTNPIAFIWAMTVSGLRIGGAFDYGINIQNKDKTESGYGNAADPAWNHDMRIEAVICGCETGVRVFNCNMAHLAVTIQPMLSTNKVDGEYVKYAKHGIVLEHSHNIDLSQSYVWDWQLARDDSEEYTHIAMYGDCYGVVLNEPRYYENGLTDVRESIYTDTPSNLEKMTILQEPITRWFKPVDGQPYFSNGQDEMPLMLRSEMQEYFITDRVANFTNVLATAKGTDGAVYNGIGYKKGTRIVLQTGEDATGTDTTHYVATGFIPIKAGDVLHIQGASFDTTDGWTGDAFYDADFNWLHGATNAVIMPGSSSSGTYFQYGERTADGIKLTTQTTLAEKGTVAYIRLCFHVYDFGDDVLISVNDEIKYVVEGFLSDGLKMKGSNMYLYSPGGKTFKLNVSENGELSTEQVTI